MRRRTPCPATRAPALLALTPAGPFHQGRPVQCTRRVQHRPEPWNLNPEQGRSVQGTWCVQQLRHVRARREPVPAPQEQGGRKIQRAAGSPTGAAPRRNSASARGGEQRGTGCGRCSCSAERRLWASMRRPCLFRRPRLGQRHVPPPLGRARTGTGRGGAAARAVRGREAIDSEGDFKDFDFKDALETAV